MNIDYETFFFAILLFYWMAKKNIVKNVSIKLGKKGEKEGGAKKELGVTQKINKSALNI